MFVGSVNYDESDRFVLGKWKKAKYVPALMKMADEILDNSIDEMIRSEFKTGSEIHVHMRADSVTVMDNGRGIPQDKVVDAETGEELLRPVAAWTRMRAGTSFTEDRVTIGTNGLGSVAVNFLSTKFNGRTWANGKVVHVNSTNGAANTKVKVKAGREKFKSGTCVEFFPEFGLFEVASFEEGDHFDLLEDRLTSLQIAFPEIRFKFNGKYLQVSNIKKYSQLFLHDKEASSLVFTHDDVSYFFCASVDGYRSNGYINGVNVRLGGSYNDWIVNGVADHLMTMIKKKYKVEVNKSSIKNGLTMVMFARNFQNPQFDSQTKERLTNTFGQVKNHYEASKAVDLQQVAKKIMWCKDIIEPIVEAQLAKKAAADKRALTLAQKKAKRVKVQAHIEGDPGATLFIVEGASATGFFLKVRDKAKAGAFPLKGKVKNTWEDKPNDIIENKELRNLITILGLDINDPDSVDNMTYGNIATLADADHDGSHISGLLLAFFYRFWPRLFAEKKVHITRTPIMISTKGTKIEWFYSYAEARKFKNENEGWKHRYIKGLASLTEEEYREIINNPVFSTIKIDDEEWFNVVFGGETSYRKDWIKGLKPEIIQAA